MGLEPGSQLGDYVVVGSLGSGGMGEVYRACDERLGREVALKVLPDGLASDPDRGARFEREAKLLASLNDPAIAHLYGFHEEDGTAFLTMEVVEGETLAERIARGAIPADEARELFLQIASGLEAAHESGIVHRDLKPANVKVTPEGRVKILDFGLAKALGPESEPKTEVSQSPTLTRGTAMGAILGTAAYMSPEQARGKAVDKRTDIWAFGCCLYEALTGRPAFEGETVSDILGSVLRDEPNVAPLPGSLRSLVERCLIKEPRSRLRDIGEARIALGSAPAPTTAAEPSRRSSPVPWVVGLGLAAVIAAWGWLREAPAPERPVVRSSLMLPHPLALGTNRPAIAISRDGRRVLAIVKVDGTTQVYLRELTETNGRLLSGTEGAVEAFFSPDGESVGFIANDRLSTLPVAGGTASMETRVSPVTRGSMWIDERRFLLNGSLNAGLLWIDEGEARRLTFPDTNAGERSHRWPHPIPGETDHALVTVAAGASFDSATLAVATISEARLEPVLVGGTDGRLTVSGHLVFGREGALFATATDSGSWHATGTPVRVQENVAARTNGAVHYDVSETGTLAYVPGERWEDRSSVGWVRRDGQFETILERNQPIWGAAISPDGRNIAMAFVELANSEVWVLDLERGTTIRITNHPGEDFNPVWSPDGQWIAFASEMSGEPPQIHRARLDGSDAELLLPREGFGGDVPSSWSPDGESIVFFAPRDIWLLRSGEAEALLQTEHTEHGGAISPDGRWLAYHSDESGRNEVYVQPFPGPGQKQLVSNDGGAWPKWSADMTRLYYRSGDRMMEVSVDTSGGLELTRPMLVFRGDYGFGINHINYDVAPDGRFLMIRIDEPPETHRIELVTNWLTELEERLPIE